MNKKDLDKKNIVNKRAAVKKSTVKKVSKNDESRLNKTRKANNKKDLKQENIKKSPKKNISKKELPKKDLPKKESQKKELKQLKKNIVKNDMKVKEKSFKNQEINRNNESRNIEKKINIKKIESPEDIKKKKKKIKVIVMFFVIGILICLIYLLLTSKTFELNKYSIEGTQKYTKDDILKDLNLKENQNIFIQYFSFMLKKDNTNLPYIEKMKISVKLPDQIVIKVEERIPKYLAYDKDLNRYFKLTEDGYILEETTLDKRKDETMMYGVSFDKEVKLDKKINEIDLIKLELYKKIMLEYNKSDIKSKITKVDFENSLTTITLDDKINVVLPNDTNLKYNINFLKTIKKQIGDDAVGKIDMTKNNPVFSSF